MTTTTDKMPGYTFAGYRFLKCIYQLLPDLLPNKAPNDIVANFEYADKATLEEKSLSLRQFGIVTLSSKDNTAVVYLKVEVVIEGHFLWEADPTIAPEVFAEKNAPAIMFPFLREAITRLTSNASPISPVILPPVNILLMRKSTTSPVAPNTETPIDP